MATMRSVPRGREPGDRELESFAHLVHRPLVVVGNGPSSAMPRHEVIPADAVVFRMNWFFLESHYHFGTRVDGWFSAVPHEQLESLLAAEVRAGRYDLERVLTPTEIASGRDGDRWGNPFTGLGDRAPQSLDSWSLTARHPRLARHFMSRPGLPTTGMQALAFGLAAGFRDVYVAGIDLYESKDARYGYTVPEQVEASLKAKDLAPGYEDAHGLGTDVAFLRACLTEFPDARVTNLSASETLALYLPGPTPLADPGRAMSPATVPHLGEPKERPTITLPGVRAVAPVEVREPLEGRLFAELDGRRCAYVTVVSGDYHHGARALANSLRAVSEVPLLVLATPDADSAAMRASGLHVIDVPAISNPVTAGTLRGAGRAAKVQSRFAATYTKLHAFRLGFLDRVVYVDADALVLANIDDLFGGDDFAAAPDSGLDLPTGEVFNSGVFAVTPSAELFARMIAALRTTPSYDGGDQGFLNVFFDAWRALPVEYNSTKRLWSHHPATVDDEDVKVLHYVGVKPWQPEAAGGRYDELDQRWLEHLRDWELRELVRDLRHRAAGAPSAMDAGPTPHRRAKDLAAQGRWAEVVTTLESAWQTREPTAPELRQMARAYRMLGRYRDSAAQLRQAVRLDPSPVVAREYRNARLRLVYGRALAAQESVRAGVGRGVGRVGGTPRSKVSP